MNYFRNNGKSKLVVNFGSEVTNFNNKLYDVDKDFELIFDSVKGIIMKKINSENSQDIEFYTNDLKSFFQESTFVDIILKDNFIYINTVDDDGETSIKIKYKLPENVIIKYLYFDAFDSENLSIKDLKKFNFIELKYLINIYIFEIRLNLSPNVKFIEKLEGGDSCDHIGKNRTSTVEYRCDPKGINEITIEKVTEPSMCEYKYYVKTKNLCNPLYLMYNKIQTSVATTKCVIQNEQFNKDSEEFFTKS